MPHDGLTVSKDVLLGSDTALALLVASAPLLSAEAVAPLADALRRSVPAAGSLLASTVRGFAAACYHLRVQRSLLFVLLHGALTYACGDVFAQAAAPNPMVATPARGAPPPTKSKRALLWRPLRTVRTALAGLVMDALPFYYWSATLQQLPSQGWVQWLMRVTHMPSRLLPAAMVGLKIALHTAIFQPVTTAGLMLSQALLRRDSWADAWSLVRRRLARLPPQCARRHLPRADTHTHARAHTSSWPLVRAGSWPPTSSPPPRLQSEGLWFTPSPLWRSSLRCATWACLATLFTWPCFQIEAVACDAM